MHLTKRRGLKNFSVLVSHVLVPPAIAAILQSPGNQVQAFLAAGHVCSVMGYWKYPPLAEKFGVPIVVTGFEPLDLLDGIRRAVAQLESGRHEVENAYSRVVTFEGNRAAPEAAERVLAVLRAHPLGKDAARIGQVTAEHKRMLVARTAMGANRVISTMIGEQLPRTC